MYHKFNSAIAEEFGLEEAILLENLYYWIQHNRKNGIHFHDGYYWTYNSVAAFVNQFTYMKKCTVRRALKHLEQEGVILTGNYNRTLYDRTTWYALTEKGLQLFENEDSAHSPSSDFDKGCKNKEIEKNENADSDSAQPIPDELTDKSTDKKKKNNRVAPAKAVEPSEQKHTYGVYENVLLTDTEVTQLKAEFPQDWSTWIEKLSAYMISTGKTYKNHLATIRLWALNAAQKVKRAITKKPSKQKNCTMAKSSAKQKKSVAQKVDGVKNKVFSIADASLEELWEKMSDNEYLESLSSQDYAMFMARAFTF